MSIFRLIIDVLAGGASDEIIDAEFILSDLVDINLTEAEIQNSAGGNAFGSTILKDQVQDNDPRSMGKQVY